jgi:muramoyltetrapeptide carboxypeptidase LdcA involved in peptidoglycan recycling
VNKPKALKKGDTIAVLSLSSGAAERFPHIYENGLSTLQEMGFQIKEYPTTRASGDYLSEHPQERARDFNAAIQDDDVSAVISSIGGEDAVRILKDIDVEAFKNNPKIVMGYSDATAYIAYLSQHDCVTFNGPTIMAGFSQAKNFEGYTQHINNILTGVETPYTYPTYKKFAHKFPDWNDTENIGKVSEKKDVQTVRWLQGETIEGKLWGGCWEVLEMMRGTPYWPKKEFFTDKILFLETSEGVPPVDVVRCSLRAYAQAGVFDELAGIIVGRSREYTQEMNDELDESLLQIAKESGRKDLSIGVGYSFGHTEPQIILPHNCSVRMSEDGSLTLLESPFK